MNLVAKEFVASRKDKKGVLILSEKAGAATELNGALLINAFDKTATSSAIYQALIMSENEQTDRMHLMQYRVKTYNVFRWADEFLLQLQDTKEEVKEFADGKNEHDKIFGHEYFVIEFMQSFYGKF